MRALCRAAAALPALSRRSRSQPRGRASELTPSGSPRRSSKRPRPGGLRSRLAARAAAALLLAGAVLFAAPVLPGAGGAANAEVLVSNIGQTEATATNVGTYDFATAFTTGSNAGGYSVTSVDIAMTGFGANNASFSVSIRTSSSGSPGTTVGTLAAPASFVSGNNSFTHSGISLDADTTYFLVVDGTSSGTGDVAFTVSDTQTGMTGWSIANGALYRTSDSASWISFTSSIKMRINGTAMSSTPADSTPTFGASTISNKTYVQHREITDLTLPAATGGDGTLTYTLTGPSGGALPAGLDFNATTRKLTGTPTASQSAMTYTYTATDSDATDPDAVSLTFTIAVTANAVPTFGANTITNQSYTQNAQIAELTLPAATGGDGTLTYALVGTLPTGLDYDSTNRKITGTPTATQTATSYTWRATDNNGDKAELTFTIEVASPLPAIPNLTVTAVTGSSDKLDVSWDAPASVTVHHYFIWWKSGDQTYSTTRRRGNLGPNAARTVQITGLSADTAYDVRVIAAHETTGDVARSEVTGTRTNAAAPTATVKAGTSPVTEGTAATFTVTLSSAAPSGGVTVNLSVSEAAGSDFVAAGNEGTKTLAFAQGDTSKTYTVATVGDTDDEPNGSVTVTLSSGTGYTLGTAKSASVTVNDDDTAGPSDSMPSFSGATISNQSYTQNTALAAWTLPAATGGDGTLTYTLTGPGGGALPAGLNFNANTRMLSGTPTTLQSATAYTYTATDGDASNPDAVSLTFTIAVITGTTNHAPVFGAASYSFSLAENADGSTTPVSVGTVSATDPDGDTVSYAMSGTGFTIGASTGAITYTGSGENYESIGTPASAFSLLVLASDGSISGQVTITVAVTDVDEAPGKPAAPTVTATSGSTTSLDVNWAAPANTGPAISGYDLRYRAGTSGSWTNGPQDQTGTSASIGSLTAGTAYQVQVRATSAEGDGAWSDSGSGSTSLPAVSGFTVTAVSGSTDKLDVSWNAVANADTYHIRWWSSNASLEFPTGTHNVGAPATSYQITGLTANTTYSVLIRAIDQPSTILARSETSATTNLPAIPNLTVTAVTGSTDKLDVSWNAPTGVTFNRYRVQWKTGGQTYGSARQTVVTAPTTTYQITGLDANTAYDVRVTALPGSVASSEASATTNAGTAPTATIKAGTSPVTEGTAATFTVTLSSAAPSGGVTVNLSVSEAVGSDFVAAGNEGTKTLAFAQGDTSKTYSVATVSDGNDEPNGAVTVTLSSGTGYTLGATTSASVTVHDHDTAGPSDSAPSFSGAVVPNQSYTQNAALAAWTLPAATGGDGTLTYTLTGPGGGARPAGLNFNAATRMLSGTPTTLQSATAYTYTVTDGDASNPDAVSLTFTIAVVTGTTNHAPVFGAASYSFTLAENADGSTTPVSVGTVSATDPDGDTVSYSFVGNGFAIASSTGAITYTGSGENYESFLVPGSAHLLTVTASDGSASNTAPVVVAVTDVDEAPGKPAAPTVTATANSRTSLDVSWSAPTNTGPSISGYDLRYRAGTSGSWTNGPQDQTGTSASIGSLTAGTAYQVQVRATNAEGDGGWSDSGVGTTSTVATPAGPTGITLTLSPSSIDEGGGSQTVTVTVALVGGTLATATSVSLSTAYGTASAADIATSGVPVSVSIPANTSSGTATARYTPRDDTANEGDETITFTASVTVGGSTLSDTATLTITDNDLPAVPGLTVTPVAGTTDQLHASWNAVSGANNYRIQWKTGGQSYSTTTRVKSTVATLRITTLTFLLAGTAYDVRVTALNAAGTVLARSEATATTDVALTVSLSVVPNPVPEGSPATVTVTLSKAVSTNTHIPLSLTPGTAEADDYGAVLGPTIAAGATTGTVVITTADDADEDDETFTVELGTLPSSVTAGSPSSVTVTIRDNDGVQRNPQGGLYVPTVRATDLARVPRNAALSPTGVVTWTLDTETEPDAIMPYMVEWIAATRPVGSMKWEWWDDHIADGGFGSIEEQECRSGRCRVQIPDFDPQWHYLVHVNTAHRMRYKDLPPAVLRHTPAPVAGAPSVTIAGGPSVTEGTAATFTVSAAPAPASDLAVYLTVSDAPGADFVPRRKKKGLRKVTVPAGRTHATLEVPTRDDREAEPGGNVTAALVASASYRLGDAASAAVTVSDNDGGAAPAPEDTSSPAVVPVATLTAGSAVTEGAAAQFRVELSHAAPAGGTTVAVTVSDAADGDFVAPGDEGAKTVTVAAGQTLATLQVPTQDDRRGEADGPVTVTLADGEGYSVGSPASAAVTARDNDGGSPAEARLTGLTVSPASGGGSALEVSWEALDEALDYVVQWKTGGQEYPPQPPAYRAAGTSYRIGDLIPGQSYTVKVTVRWRSGFVEDIPTLGPSAEARGTVPALTIEGVEVRTNYLNDAQVTVAWPAVPGAAAYRIEYKEGTAAATAFTVSGTHGAGSLGTLMGTTKLGASVTGLKGATTYTVRVVAIYGSLSGPEMGHGEAVGRTRDAFGPIAVSGVAGHDDTLDVSWTGFPGDRFFYIVEYRKTGATGAFTAVTRADRKATTERIAGLDRNTGYTVKVRVRYQSSPTLDIAVVEAQGTGTTGALSGGEAGDQEAPQGVGAAPLSGLTVSSVDGAPTQLAVSWDAVEGAARYAVRWKTGSGEYGDAVRASTNSHTVTGLEPGTGYTVNVAAIDADNTLLAEGVASGDTGAAGREPEAPAAPAAPRFVIYHDASDPAAVARYEKGVQALGDAGVSHVTRHSSSAEVDPLAGVTHSIMPRFFFGDPAAPGWGPSQPKVNNGGLRWLKAHLATLSGLSVADARVTEASGARLAFPVTLGSAAAHTVTVAYATADGTAKAGEDYTAASGTLTFAAGETSKTVSVAVLDDAHDEGEETLTLTLSSAAGARIADGEATGTIANTDPLQQEWLARFGRTVAGQMIEALEGRFAAAPGTASHMTIAGRRLDFSGTPPPLPQYDRWRDDEWRGEETRAMDTRELLLGSSFHFTAGEVSGLGAMTAWGKALSGSSSSSPGGGLSLSSETVTGVLGMDFERDNLLVGLALSESVETGAAGFAQSGGDYDIEGSLSLVTPYARLRASDRLSVWTMMGSGEGSMALSHGDARQSADIALQVVAAGGRAELLRPEGEGFSLALKTDAYFVRTESESVSAPGLGNLAGATGDASRVRAVLEGSRVFALSGGGSVEPSLSLGLRHDGGDAETGSGVELGAGLAWSDPSRGLTSDLRLYGLAAHEAGSYDEWGVSGSLRIAPPPSGRGLSLSMTPSWGAEGQSGRLWETRPSALAGDGGEAPGARLDTELGYGLSLSGGLTGTPYVGLGLGEVRDYRLGWRLASGRWQSFSLGVEASRREAATSGSGSGAGSAEHRIGLEAGFRW